MPQECFSRRSDQLVAQVLVTVAYHRCVQQNPELSELCLANDQRPSPHQLEFPQMTLAVPTLLCILLMHSNF